MSEDICDCECKCNCDNEPMVDNKRPRILAGLSDKSLGVILLCLQKSIIEGTDITGLFRELLFQMDPDGKLEVINPPTDLNINCPKEWLDESRSELN